MVLVGLAFLVDWLQVQVFNVDIVKSLLITAIIFILIGLLLGERPFVDRIPR